MMMRMMMRMMVMMMMMMVMMMMKMPGDRIGWHTSWETKCGTQGDTKWERLAISARAVHLIALEPKVRSFATLAVLVQTSPRCWDLGAHKRRKQQKPPKQGKCAPPQPGARAQIANKKDDQHARCSARMPLTYLAEAVKIKFGALKRRKSVARGSATRAVGQCEASAVSARKG